MPEWWTYRLSDFLMFEPRTYYRLFELYNREVWPAPLLALLLGPAVGALAWHDDSRRRRLVWLLLLAVWLWVAVAFQWRRYTTINLAAGWFAGGFLLEALLFGAVVFRDRPAATPGRRSRAIGIGVVAVAVLLQPLLGPLQGRAWSQVELFGLAPDPTVLATLGLLLVLAGSWFLYIIPLLWCLATGATLWAMEAPDAWLMPAVALVVIGWRVARRWAGEG